MVPFWAVNPIGILPPSSFANFLIKYPSIMKTFSEFETEIRELYEAAQYTEIIDRIDAERANYPGQHIYLAYWQITMAARAGNNELAFHFMDELISNQQWISSHLLLDSPSLEGLQDLSDYRERFQKMVALQQKEQAQILPLLVIHKEEADLKVAAPLMIGLHKGHALALDSIKFWQSAAQLGWLVGVPQSSQAMWSGQYVWEDRETAYSDIESHIKDLAAKYVVDPQRIIVAGHEAGGELAAWLLLSGGLSARGFVLINPTGPFIKDPNQWMRLLQIREPENLRGAIVLAEEAPGMDEPEIRRMVDILNTFEVPCHLEIIKAGQAYDPIYDEAIQKAINFVLS